MRYIIKLLSVFAVVHSTDVVADVFVSKDRMDDTVDDTAYFQDLINSAPNGATIRIPAGQLTLSGAIDVFNATENGVVIKGADSNLTTLRFNGGGLNCLKGARVSGITMVTTRANAGVAIYSQGGRASVSDVVIRGWKSNHFWNKSVEVNGTSGRISDSAFYGKNDGDNGTTYHIEHYGKTGGGGVLTASNTRLSGAKYGVYVHNTDAEGHGFSNMIIDNVEVAGIRTTAEPTFAWSYGWLKASQFGVQIDGSRDTSVRSNVIEISDDLPDGAAVTYSKRTQQNSVVRGNLIDAPNAIRVLTRRPIQGNGSSNVNDVSVMANYIENAQDAYNLVGRSYRLFFSGNVLDNVQNEFLLNENPGVGQRFFRSELEVRK